MSSQRHSTGPLQFGDDWPGVFIRGDEALAMAERLRRLESLPPQARAIVLNDLAEILESCRVPLRAA